MQTSRTIHNIDSETMRYLQAEAKKKRGISIDTLILQLIQESIHINQKLGKNHIYHDLDALAGTWNEKEAKKFAETIEDMTEKHEQAKRGEGRPRREIQKDGRNQ